MSKNPYKEASRYTEKQLAVLDEFGLGPKLKLNDFDRDILDVMLQLEEPGFYEMCEAFDLKPSKMEKHLIRLEEKGLVEYTEAAGKVYLTDIAVRYILNYKRETKSEKLFRAFIESLNDEELDEFIAICNQFQFELPEEEEDADMDEEGAEGSDDGFIIIDETEAEYDNADAEDTDADADDENDENGDSEASESEAGDDAE